MGTPQTSVEVSFTFGIDDPASTRAAGLVAEMAVHLSGAARRYGAGADFVPADAVRFVVPEGFELPKTEFSNQLGPGADLLGAGVQARLNEPFVDLWGIPSDSREGATRTKALGNLRRIGLITVRELCAVGAVRLSHVSGLGEVAIARILELRADHVPEIPAVSRMQPSDIARFCSSLDVVPLAAATIRVNDLDPLCRQITVDEAVRVPAGTAAVIGVEPETYLADWFPEIFKFMLLFERGRQVLGGATTTQG